MADEIPRWRPAPDTRCARCHVNAVGPGGVICPSCRTDIEAANQAPGQQDDQAAASSEEG